MLQDIQKIKTYSNKEDRLADYSGADRVISSKEMQDELAVAKGKAVYNFRSGLPTLDQITEGFESGELIVVSGYTGHGKTSFCQSLTVSIEEHCDAKTLWFSYEMPPRQFLLKFPEGLPLFYMPREMKGKEADWIEDRIIEAKAKYEIKMVMIDHLHFLVDMVKMKQPSLEIGTIVRTLKQLAIKHNIVIFLIAHTSMPKSDKSPGLEDIRDSSFITQEADSVMVIKRVKNKKSLSHFGYTDQAEVFILKHRRLGTIGRKVLLLYQDRMFHEVSTEETQDQEVDIVL